MVPQEEMGSGIVGGEIMKFKVSKVFFVILSLAVAFLSVGQEVQAACRNPNIAEDDEPFLKPAAASGVIEIKWFGHSFFQLTSSSGTKIITDPFGPMGFPMPEVWPNIVTVGREHGNHNNVGLAKGSPIILRGLKEGADEWNEVNFTFHDVLIYNVPVHQRGVPGYYRSLKGSGFVFEMDGLCIFHSGDVSEPFNEDQLQLIGHVDVLLQVIGGVYTIGPEGAKQVIEQLKPKLVIPMHYWYHYGHLERFIDGPYQVHRLDTNSITVSKDTLPSETEIFVLKVVREGDL
jgi:L-ascorbate metabolism protein UlaG (beta-lactamase superfamily)